MLLHTGRVAPTRHWRMPRHVHASHDELIVVVAGELHTQIAGQTLVGTPGTVLHYPHAQPHIEHAAGHVPLETLYIAFRPPPQLALAPLSRDRAGHVLHAARWMLALGSTGNPADFAAAESLLTAILHELSSRDATPETDLVRRIQRYIEYHLAEPLTLDALADEAGMSKFHFARTFTRAAGQSPMACVRHARIKAARILLQTSALPLRAIAPLVGFTDQTHLSRTFRRVTGLAPGQCRNHERSASAGSRQPAPSSSAIAPAARRRSH